MSETQKPLSEERKALERLVCRALLVLVAAGLAAWLIPICWDKLSPFIICVPIAAMLQPCIVFLQQKCKLKPAPSAMIPMLLVVALVVGVIYWFASFGFTQLNNLIANAPALLADAAGSIRAAFESLIAAADSLPQETVAWLRTALNDALSWLTTKGTALGGRLVGAMTGMAAGVPYAFIYLNFLLLGLYFICKDYGAMRAKLPGGRAHNPNTNASQLTKAAIVGALGYLRVQAIYGIGSLIVGWIYLQCMGNPYAWLIAAIAGTLEFLPLFGNGTLYVPWAIVAYLVGMPDISVKVLVLYGILLGIRRVTEPKLMSANIGVSPLLSLVGMFAGMRAGGLVGLIGGPIVVTVLTAVVKGHYLDGIQRDIHTLVTFCRRRWDWREPAPFVPPEEPPQNEPAPRRRKWKAAGKANPLKGNAAKK